jgi:hypothetical protein
MCLPTSRRYVVQLSGRQPMGREKILVVRGEIRTLFSIFMFIILIHYILIRLRVHKLISNKQQQISH